MPSISNSITSRSKTSGTNVTIFLALELSLRILFQSKHVLGLQKSAIKEEAFMKQKNQFESDKGERIRVFLKREGLENFYLA